MGLFSIGEHTNQSTTNNRTDNTYTDTSANAGGDNSLAVGSGATVNIANLSEKVANTAINDASAVALGTTAANSDLSKYAIGTQYATAKESIAAGLKGEEFVANTLAGLQETSARENQDTRNAANLAIQSNSGLTEQLNGLTAAALNRAQAPEATSVATILKPVLLGLAAIIGLFFVFNSKGQTSHK